MMKEENLVDTYLLIKMKSKKEDREKEPMFQIYVIFKFEHSGDHLRLP